MAGDDADRLGVTSAVSLTTGLLLLVLVTVAATWYAAARLRRLRLSSDE